MEEEIRIINEIIAIAINHGGDPGGPYFIAHKELYEAIYAWLEYHHLENDYIIVGGGTLDDEFEYDDVPMIIPISEYKNNESHYIRFTDLDEFNDDKDTLIIDCISRKNPVDVDNSRPQDELNSLIDKELDTMIEDKKE